MAIESVRKVFRPLASRKVRVALASLVAAALAEYGLGVDEGLVYGILGLGAALILGIAHEDAGRLAGGASITVAEPAGEGAGAVPARVPAPWHSGAAPGVDCGARRCESG